MSEDKILQDARRFATQFSGFLQAAEKWQGVVSFEQAAQEGSGASRQAARRNIRAD
jgi:hypothetical protein